VRKRGIEKRVACGELGARRRRAVSLNEAAVRRRTLFPGLGGRGRHARIVSLGVQNAPAFGPDVTVRVEQRIHARNRRGWSSRDRDRENAAVAATARPATGIDRRIHSDDDGQNGRDRPRRELSSEAFHRPHHSPHSARGALLPSTLRLATPSVNENSR